MLYLSTSVTPVNKQYVNINTLRNAFLQEHVHIRGYIA